jgi:uncharacterized protein (DUF983 family)
MSTHRTPRDANTTPLAQGASGGLTSWLWALIRQRCPRCHKGRMFRTLLQMNDPCPVCGLLFQREEGYFLGAMYVSYFLSAAVLIPLYLIAMLLMPNHNSIIVALVATAAYLPFIPFVYRYSRLLWIYLDRAVCGGETSAQVYEKVRKEQLAEQSDKRPN